MKAHKGAMLPMISARGNMSARGGQESQRSRVSDNSKFNKLKGVLVNNLLKYYHKETKRQGGEEVYAKAVQEVERILQHGKLREKDLRDLQHNFATGMGIAGSMVPQPPSGPKKSSAAGGRATGRDGMGSGPADAMVEYDAQQYGEGMSTASGSPSKRQVTARASRLVSVFFGASISMRISQ
jgi:hypothetical protein